MGIEIPNEVYKKVKAISTENVLLLAMSKLPKNIHEYEYYFENEDNERWLFFGKSQLAADTKTILSIIDSLGEQIDRVVILATKEARCNEVQMVDNVNIGESSAVDFYIDEIINYVQNDNTKSNEHKVKAVKVDRAKFIVINLDSANSFVETVNAIKGTDEKNINLYIDVQGGIRSTTTQINAITELLKSQDVRIVGRYANDFAPTENEPYKIHTVDYEYKTYELVTAMEIFKKYGRGEGLIKYFSELKESDHIAEKLSSVVEQAASAIQLCDVDKFDVAINLIRDINDEILKHKEELSPELKLICDDIWEDYRPLVEAKYRYVEQIRWCLKKNFIQQALTILESKMPEEYVMNGVYYPANIKEKENALTVLEKIFLKKYKNSREHYKMQNVNHYFINYYDWDSDNSLRLFCHYGLDSKDYEQNVIKNLKDYKTIKRSRNNTNHAHSTIKNDGFVKHMEKKYPKLFKDNNHNIDIIADINNYLDDWVILADKVPDTVKQNVADLR